MKVLHIIKQEPDATLRRIIEAQRAGLHNVKVIDLSKGGVDPAALVADVFAHDRVFSW